MPNRNLLLPAPPDERTCKGCRHEDASERCCIFLGATRGGSLDARYWRRSAPCLAAEQSARDQSTELARLRRVEEAARGYVTTGTKSAWSNHALHRLRAALEER